MKMHYRDCLNHGRYTIIDDRHWTESEIIAHIEEGKYLSQNKGYFNYRTNVDRKDRKLTVIDLKII